MKKIFVILILIVFIAALSSCGNEDNMPMDEADTKTIASASTKLSKAPATPHAQQTPMQTPKQTLTQHWVTVVVAFDNYHEGEFAGVADALNGGGYHLVLVSTQNGTARGMNGGRLQIDKTFEDVEDVGLGVIVIGGTGIIEQWNNHALIALVQKADEQGGIVAGICAAPCVLGNAGVLDGKTACWYDGPNTNAEMRGAGCENSGQPVTVDGNAVTGSGPSAAEAFGCAIVSVLDAL